MSLISYCRLLTSYARCRFSMYLFTSSIECFHSSCPSRTFLTVSCRSLPWKSSYALPCPNSVGVAWCKCWQLRWVITSFNPLCSVTEHQPLISLLSARTGTSNPARPPNLRRPRVMRMCRNCWFDASLVQFCCKAFSWLLKFVELASYCRYCSCLSTIFAIFSSKLFRVW